MENSDRRTLSRCEKGINKLSSADREFLNEGYDSANTTDRVVHEKESEAFAGGRQDSTLSARTSSTLRKKSIASVERIISSILDEPVGQCGPSESRPWRARVVRFGPIAGILSMLVALGSIITSFGILAGSRGDAVDSWITAPPTYLAICTAVANLAMRYACIQGVIIAWWTRALRGSTVKRLHEDWRAGTSLRGALTSGHLGLLSLACIVSTLVVIDGPLLQKASTVRSTPLIGKAVDINVNVAQEIPRDYTGGWVSAKGDASRGTIWQDAFNRSSIPSAINGTSRNWFIAERFPQGVVEAWAHQWVWGGTVSPYFTSGCDSNCKVKIRAPALAKTACRNFLVPVNYTHVYPENDFNQGLSAPPLELEAFIIDIQLQIHQNESIDFVTGFSQTYNGIGSLNITTCNLVSAVGEYEVIITSDPPSVDSTWTPEIVAVANNTRVNHHWSSIGGYPSTLAGLVNEAYNKWACWETAWTEPNGNQGGTSMNTYATDFFRINAKSGGFNNWTDPQERVMKDLNKLMFVTGVYAAMHEDHAWLDTRLDPGLPLNTTVTGSVLGHHNVFETHYNWFVGAAIVEIVCILLVLPTYWGWWHVGRPMSFSPIEIAKAFGSPILDQCNSNSSGREIAKTVEEMPLQYGATSYNNKTMVLAFARPELVDRPVKDATFDE